MVSTMPILLAYTNGCMKLNIISELNLMVNIKDTNNKHDIFMWMVY